jgi:hypothetical protein
LSGGSAFLVLSAFVIFVYLVFNVLRVVFPEILKIGFVIALIELTGGIVPPP